MPSVELYSHQKDALDKMKNGCILCGGVGSGKSITSLSYYYKEQGGRLDDIKTLQSCKDLYIITTAMKRDSLEWEKELMEFKMYPDKEFNYQPNKVVIDSWNNIKKYVDIKDAFFIFDEQRVVGYGAWSKSFIKIARNNDWILLSATPGDKYEDYMPVFIANGFYRNKTDFVDRHIVYDYKVKFPKVDRYLETRRLDRLRNLILVKMDYASPSELHHEDVYVDYDIFDYKRLIKDRFDYENDKPIESASELCVGLRRIVNSDPSRGKEVLKIFREKKKVIIFYNYDFELDILKSLPYVECLAHTGTDFMIPSFDIAEWNGHKHQQIPDTDCWVYLVQYNAGNEGWNCISTDTIIFYSQNYSYRMMVQAAGRIDRMNTPFRDLYFYHIKSRSGIDLAINRALKAKKKFNEAKFDSEIFKYSTKLDRVA